MEKSFDDGFKSYIDRLSKVTMYKCTMCGIEISKLDTISVSSKTYKDICYKCEEKIKSNRVEKLVRLKKSIYNRKHLNEILLKTGIPLYHFEKYKLNKLSIMIKNYLKEKDTVFIYSEKQGTGKTTATLASMRHFIRKGYSPIFIRSVDLFNSLRSVYANQNKIDITEVLQKYFDTDLLIIDDVGTEKGSSFVETQIYSIIDHRVFYGKKTIITSILSPQRIAEMYGSNLASRICSGQIIKVNGEDLRIKK